MNDYPCGVCLRIEFSTETDVTPAKNRVASYHISTTETGTSTLVTYEVWSQNPLALDVVEAKSIIDHIASILVPNITEEWRAATGGGEEIEHYKKSLDLWKDVGAWIVEVEDARERLVWSDKGRMNSRRTHLWK